MAATVYLGQGDLTNVIMEIYHRIYKKEVGDFNKRSKAALNLLAANVLSKRQKEMTDANPWVSQYIATSKRHSFVTESEHPLNPQNTNRHSDITLRRPTSIGVPQINISYNKYGRETYFSASIATTTAAELETGFLTSRKNSHIIQIHDPDLAAFHKSHIQLELEAIDLHSDVTKIAKFLNTECITVNRLLAAFPNAYKALPVKKRAAFDPTQLHSVRGFKVPEWCNAIDVKLAVSFGLEALAVKT